MARVWKVYDSLPYDPSPSNLAAVQLIQCAGDQMSPAASLQDQLYAKSVPFPRSGHRIVATDRYVYCIGGYNPDLWSEDQGVDTYYPIFKELWRYNILLKKWKKLSATQAMPNELASHAATHCDRYLVVFGGTGVPFGHSSSNDIHICDLKTLSWKLLPTGGQVPQKQYGHSIVNDGHDLFVVGGTTGFTYNMEVHHINLLGPKHEWTNLSSPPDPAPRYRHEVIYFEGKLLVLGGGTSEMVCSLNLLDVFELDKKNWTTMPTKPDNRYGYPLARRCHAIVVFNNKVYLTGGYDGTLIFDDVWILDLSSMQWKKLVTVLPAPAFFHDATVTPSGQMFMFGGVTHINNLVRTNSICSSWLCPPTLVHTAAKAMLNHFPPLAKQRSAMLRSLGIPRQVVEWIKDHGY